MVNLIASPDYLTFSKEDDKSLSHPHNLTLHIEVMIHKTHVRHMLIDGGARLNICSLSLLKTLGYSEHVIDSKRKITIKAYDEIERSSKGLVVLPIRIGPMEKDVLFQIVDAGPLVYNILLGRPWIHDMKLVPAIYL